MTVPPAMNKRIVFNLGSVKTEPYKTHILLLYPNCNTKNGAGKDRKTSISYEEKDIVDPSELITLKNTGEAILITPYGYMRVKKTPYFSDKYLKPMAERIIKYNRAVQAM